MNFDKLYNEAKSNSVDFHDYDPTIFDNIKNGVGTLLSGVYSGLVAKPSTLLGGAMVSAMEKLDELVGMDADSSQTEYLKNSLAATVKQTQLMQETAQNSGQITAALYSISDVLSSYVGAGKLAKGVGATATSAGTVQGYADYEQGLADGLDKTTAAEKGIIAGGSIALGGYIPLTMGFRLSPTAKAVLQSQTKLQKTLAYSGLLAEDVTYTAGANIAIGAGYRGFTHEILKANGYDQMADQYQALDESAMLIDAAFGIIFGGVAKYAEIRNQNYIDALLAKNNQLHQAESAMGIPTDVGSLNMHNKALEKAFDDMIHGRPVDVESIFVDAEFLPKDNVDWNSKVLESITKQFPDEAVFYSREGTPIPGRVINEVREQLLTEANSLIKVTERKKLIQEIHDLNYKADKAEKDRLNLLNQKREVARGKKGSQERQSVKKETERLNALAKDFRKLAYQKQQYLKNHTRGGKHFDAKGDLTRLEQGIIPKRLASLVIEKTGLKASEIKESLSIYDKSKAETVSNAEFRKMQEKATYDDVLPQDAINQLLNENPNMELKYLDESGIEQSVKATDLIDSVTKELEQAQADKKLYYAAIACMLRTAQ